MTATVQFGPVPMTGALPVRDGMFVVEAKFFHDWYTTSDSKTPIRERPVQDGAFGYDRDWRTGLVLAMNGRFRGDTWQTMFRQLEAVCAPGVTVQTTVADDLGISSRALQVRSFRPQPIPGAKLCYFTMDLFAPDARRYGPVVTVSTGLPSAGTGQPWPQTWPAQWGTGGDPGRVTLTNTGNAPTSPLLKARGGLSGGVQLVEITTGSYLQVDRDIPPTSTVVFDTRTSRVYLDIPDNDISGSLTRRDWAGFQLPGGATRVVQFNGLGVPSGSPLLTAEYRPAN